jgi:hypothetical protein
MRAQRELLLRQLTARAMKRRLTIAAGVVLAENKIGEDERWQRSLA